MTICKYGPLSELLEYSNIVYVTAHCSRGPPSLGYMCRHLGLVWTVSRRHTMTEGQHCQASISDMVPKAYAASCVLLFLSNYGNGVLWELRRKNLVRGHFSCFRTKEETKPADNLTAQSVSTNSQPCS